MSFFIQQFINGLGTGSQYALWCVGYGLVYQVLGLMHFAHGDSLLFATFAASSLMVIGVPFWLVVIFGCVLAAAIAIGIERVLYRPIMSRGLTFLAFIAAMAGGFVLRSLVQVIWGVQPRTFPEGLLPSGAFVIGGIHLEILPLTNLAIALLVVVVFSFYLSRTRTGQAILAVAQDRYACDLMGISVNRIVALVYGLSGSIGFIGVILYAANYRSVAISLGFAITMKAFIAAIIGGIGSIRGAVLGGLALGLLESFTAAYISTTLMDAVVTGCLILFLLFRPYGITGRRELVKL
jgi:branched-chain amino acid transport system permease protein